MNNKLILNLQTIPDIKSDLRSYLFEKEKYLEKDDGIWMEFGVYSGKTINYFSNFTDNIIYGFDSFEGLPEFWREYFPKGAISANGKLPKVNKNVQLIKGLFQDTLLPFLKDIKMNTVSFVHIDSDLYSSCKYVLNTLIPYFKDSCIILFDELFNYPGYENGELKAINEFMIENKNSFKLVWIGMNGNPGINYNDGNHHENCAIKLIRIK